MGIAPEGYDDIKNFAKALDNPIKSKTGETYVEIPNPERTLPIIKKVMNKAIAVIEKTRELTKKVKNQMGKAKSISQGNAQRSTGRSKTAKCRKKAHRKEERHKSISRISCE